MVFEGFTLIQKPKKEVIDPTSQRRRRILMQIDKQVSIVELAIQGRKTRGRWWTTDNDGKFILAIKYGKHPLELVKGKQAAVCDTMEDLKKVLNYTKTLVVSGTFDSQMKTISEQIKSRFKKVK